MWPLVSNGLTRHATYTIGRKGDPSKLDGRVLYVIYLGLREGGTLLTGRRDTPNTAGGGEGGGRGRTGPLLAVMDSVPRNGHVLCVRSD